MKRTEKEELLSYLEGIELYDWQEPLDVTWRTFGDDDYLVNVRTPIVFGWMLDYICPYLDEKRFVWYISTSDSKVYFSIQ